MSTGDPDVLGRTSAPGLLQGMAALAAAALILVLLAAGVAGENLTALRVRAEVERRTSRLAVATRARLQGAPATAWESIVVRTGNRTGTIAALLAPGGQAIAGTLPTGWSTAVQDLRGSPAHRALEVDDREYWAEVDVVDPPTGTRLLLAAPYPRDPGGRSALLASLLTVLGALGALAVGSALVVARDVTADLRALTRRAQRMVNGGTVFDPLPLPARDEVGDLVLVFNRVQRRFAQRVAAHRQALDRLEEAERRKDVLITTLRHELRTPLNAILGFADVLLSGIDGELNDAQREDVEVVARSGRHLQRLVDDVLDLSAIASGRFAIERVPTDVLPVVRDIVRESRVFARTRDVNLKLEAEGPALVDGDAVALRRAITNLVRNALEHARSQVTVSVRGKDRDVRVSVQDDGAGIPKGELERLFKPFERGSRRNDPARPGVGLGLAITVALTELHEGRVTAESTPGAGSTFFVTLPRRPTALEQAGIG